MYTKNFASSVLLLVLSYDASAFTFPSSKSQPELKSSTVGIQSDTHNIQGSTNEDLSRRDIFSHSLNAILAASAALAPLTANAVVVQSGPCASGEGAACENLADGNEFILSLQKKSATNREKNEKEALLAYNMKNYPDFFASLTPPKFMVMNTDGKTFQVFTEAELSELKNAGKVSVQMPKTMGGKVTDVTQKPYLKFKE